MANTDKNIVITPNIGQTSDPVLAFIAANTTVGAQTIFANVYPNFNGTISFEGSAGQLFSITNSLTGTIFSVNDVSGIPSIEVLSTGLIKLAQYNGSVGIGTSAANALLDVNGNAIVRQGLTINSTNTSTSTTTGALVLTGGLGVGGNINVGGTRNTLTGYVGIGTSTAGNQLSVYGTDYVLFNNRPGAAARQEIVVGNVISYGAVLGYDPSVGQSIGYLRRGDSAATAPAIAWAYVSSNYRVGINAITQPQNALDVAGAVAIGSGYSGLATMTNTNGLSVQGSVGIGTFTPSTSSSVATLFSATGAGMQLASGGAAGGGNIRGITGGGLQFGTYTGGVGAETFTERMTIDSAGEVGIATNNPLSTLDVNGVVSARTAFSTAGTATVSSLVGNVAISIGGAAIGSNDLSITGAALGTALNSTVPLVSMYSTTTNADYLEFFTIRNASGGTDWTTAGNRIQERVDSTYMGWIGFNNGNTTVTNNGGISFGTGTSTLGPNGVGEKMRLDSSGRLGLATTAPGSTLDVNGVASFRSAISAAGAASVASLTSNGAISGTTGSFSGIISTTNGSIADITNGLRIANPGGGTYVSSVATVTGAIKIRLPTAAFKSATMQRMTIMIYEYAGSAAGTSRRIEVGGYNYTDGAWYNYFATQVTMGGSDINVRFGNDTTGNCIWIGDVGTVWNYPQVFVTDWQGGYSNYTVANYGNGWTVTITGTLDTVTNGPITCAKNLTTTGGWTVTGTGTFTSTLTTTGISFSVANPSITASSYTTFSGGLYVSGGTLYSQVIIYARGGIANDAATSLSITGGTTNITNVTGTLNATGEITAYSSDLRLKEGIRKISDPMGKVSRLRGVIFTWKQDAVDHKVVQQVGDDVGVIAQEVQAVLPEAVRIAPFDRNDDGTSKSGESYLTVQYEKLTALLIEAVKEQQATIDDLRARVSRLESAGDAGQFD